MYKYKLLAILNDGLNYGIEYFNDWGELCKRAEYLASRGLYKSVSIFNDKNIKIDGWKKGEFIYFK